MHIFLRSLRALNSILRCKICERTILHFRSILHNFRGTAWWSISPKIDMVLKYNYTFHNSILLTKRIIADIRIINMLCDILEAVPVWRVFPGGKRSKLQKDASQQRLHLVSISLHICRRVSALGTKRPVLR